MDSDNEQLQQYAQKSRELIVSHEAGHAVLAEYFGFELRNLSIEAVVSADGAIGGQVDINFERLFPNSPDFDERLQDVATVLMGGIAAEELTHSLFAKKSHGKKDVSDFKERAGKLRTEPEMEAILEEGYRRAKTLFRDSRISEQHNRLYRFLATEPQLREPNGRFLCRVMKGLSS